MLRSMAARASGLGSLAARALAVSSRATVASRQYATASSSAGLKPYADIPGPRKFPFLGSAWDLVWAKLTKKPTYDLWMKRYQKYGKIYRYKFPNMPEGVVVHDAIDMEKTWRVEGKYPSRPPLTAFIEARKDMNMKLGLLLLEGEEWSRIRVPMSKYAMVPRKVAEHHEEFNDITRDLVKSIRRKRNPESNIVYDVPDLFFNWSFESVTSFMLGKRLGALSDPIPPDCHEWIHCQHSTLEAQEALLMGPPFYKLWATKHWKVMQGATKRIYELAMPQVKGKVEKLIEDSKNISQDDEAPSDVDFLTYLVLNGKFTLEEAVTNGIDVMNGGIDTTAFGLSWCLYHLGTNPEVQEKLRSEVQRVVGSEDIVTPAHISKMSYLRDTLKEIMRIMPIVTANARIVREDLELAGYHIPAGTMVITSNAVAAHMPEVFPEPDRLIPERWSRDNKETPSTFSFLPFGFGPRMCVGRRLAEIELHTAMAHIVKNFKVEFPEKEPLGVQQMVLNLPDRQMNLRFTDLNTKWVFTKFDLIHLPYGKHGGAAEVMECYGNGTSRNGFELLRFNYSAIMRYFR